MEERLNDLADVVRARRVALGLRQQELADLAGCSSRFVASMEAGKRTLQLDKVLDVCAVVGLDLVLEPGDGSLISSIEAPGDSRRRVRSAVRRTR